MSGQMRSLFSVLFFLLFSNHLLAEPLEPGNVYVLKSANQTLPIAGSDDECTIFRQLTTICHTDKEGDQFGARNLASSAFSRSSGQAMQYYEIQLSGEPEPATPIWTQISGKADFDGFMAIIGGGQTKVSFDLNIVDMGPIGDLYADGGKLVHSQSLASHDLTGSSATGPEVSFNIEGGAPYIGAGLDAGLKFNVSLYKKVVRDAIDFGFQVLLIRGHQYQLQFEVQSMVKRSAVPGLAVSHFMFDAGGDNTPQNLLDPAYWLDGVRQVLDTQIKDRITSLPLDIQENDGGWAIFDIARRLAPRVNQKVDVLLTRMGAPTSFADLVSKRLESSALLQIIDEGFDEPGAELVELSVVVETDQVEILRENTRLLEDVVDLLNTPQGKRSGFPKK